MAALHEVRRGWRKPVVVLGLLLVMSARAFGDSCDRTAADASRIAIAAVSAQRR